MKNHTITIKNLGPIKEIKNFEVKKFNILIGENASGKSLLAKAIWLFNGSLIWDFFASIRSIRHLLGAESHPIGDLTAEDTEEDAHGIKNKLEPLFGSYDGYELTYNYSSDLSIAIVKKGGGISVKWSSGIKDQVAKIDGMNRSLLSNNFAFVNALSDANDKSPEAFSYMGGKVAESAGHAYAKNFVNEIYGILPTVFIPDIRSFVANFDAIRLNILDNPALQKHSNDVLVGDVALKSFARASRDFIKGYQSLESKEHRRLMKGDVIKDGLDRLRFIPADNPQQEIPIGDIGSGQKDLFPILLVLQSIAKAGKPYLLIIENPEAHHFPQLQKALLEEIVKCVNTTGSKLLMTTHSPLLVADANNLIEAHDKQYKKFIKQNKFIDGEQLNASKLANGKCRSVLFEKSHLIDGYLVEKAAESIVNDFDKITMSK